MYRNRRRIRGPRGLRLLRLRGERLERPFTHLYETGGMRRVHLRGHTNILKRLLIHIRLAIGARGADVSREIALRGLGLTGAGLLFGLVAARRWPSGRIAAVWRHGPRSDRAHHRSARPRRSRCTRLRAAGAPCEPGRSCNRAAGGVTLPIRFSEDFGCRLAITPLR